MPDMGRNGLCENLQSQMPVVISSGSETTPSGQRLEDWMYQQEDHVPALAQSSSTCQLNMSEIAGSQRLDVPSQH